MSPKEFADKCEAELHLQLDWHRRERFEAMLLEWGNGVVQATAEVVQEAEIISPELQKKAESAAAVSEPEPHE